MRIRLLIFASLCLLAAPGHSSPYSLTGNDLLARCAGPYATENDKSEGVAFCQGYIQGIQQMHYIVVGLRNVQPLYCDPTESGNYDQMQRVLVKYLQDNPQNLHRDARLLVTAAFAQAFPCSSE